MRSRTVTSPKPPKRTPVARTPAYPRALGIVLAAGAAAVGTAACMGASAPPYQAEPLTPAAVVVDAGADAMGSR